jgi:hypothetical protein
VANLNKEYYHDDEESFYITEKGMLMLDTVIFTLFLML